MKAEYISPFVEAASRVIEAVLKMPVTRGRLSVLATPLTSQQCNVVTGVTGQVEGVVIYGMSLATADRIASAMIGHTIVTFDRLAASAIAELGNMITGNAMTLLAEQGYRCDITPPSIVRGASVSIDTIVSPALVVPLCIEHGQIELTVCLRHRGAP